MKKILLLVLIVFSCMFFLFANSKLTEDFLINNTFNTSGEFFGSSIKFFKNNKYEISYGSEGLYWYNEGKYEIKNDRIELNPEICKEGKDEPNIYCNNTINNGYCYIKDDLESLLYSKKLICQSVKNKNKMGFHEDGIDYDISSFKVKIGEQRKILRACSFADDNTVKDSINVNIPVIVMGQSKGLVKTNLKMRMLPSVSSQIIKYARDYEDTPINYIPKDTEIIILARTVEMTEVDKWKNYWYFVEAGCHDGWVFAEFVEIKQ